MKKQGAELVVCILTISDRSFRGETEDVSGELLKKRVLTEGWVVKETSIVPDEGDAIKQVITGWRSQEVSLILTTGGTGIGPRDVTPETVQSLWDKEIPGIGELMRSEGLKKTLFSALSRSAGGFLGKTIIVTLPGSPKGATESFEAIVSLLPHAAKMINGGDH